MTVHPVFPSLFCRDGCGHCRVGQWWDAMLVLAPAQPAWSPPPQQTASPPLLRPRQRHRPCLQVDAAQPKTVPMVATAPPAQVHAPRAAVWVFLGFGVVTGTLDRVRPTRAQGVADRGRMPKPSAGPAHGDRAADSGTVAVLRPPFDIRAINPPPFRAGQPKSRRGKRTSCPGRRAGAIRPAQAGGRAAPRLGAHGIGRAPARGPGDPVHASSARRAAGPRFQRHGASRIRAAGGL